MTFRPLMAIGLAACSGPLGTSVSTTKPDTTETDDGCRCGVTDSGPIHDSGPPEGFVPRNLVAQASLVIDGPNGVLATATDPTGTVTYDSFIALEFGDDAWKAANEDPTLTDDYCVLVMPLTNSAQAAWLPPDWYFGVDYDGGPDGAQTNCGDATHPMDALFPGYATTTGGGTTATTLGGTVVDGLGPWGAAIGPATSLVTNSTGTIAVAAIGGMIHNSGFLDPTGAPGLGTDIDPFDHFLVFGFALDEDLAIELDAQGNAVPIDPADVYDGTSVRSGIYNLFDFYIWSFAL